MTLLMRLCIVHMIGVDCYLKYICMLILVTMYECGFFYVCIPSLVFLSLKLYVYWLILQLQTCTWGVLEYVVIAHDSWFQ